MRSALSTATRRGPACRAGGLIVDLAELIRDVAAGAVLDAVGIGASGPVDSRGIIRNDDTLPAYSHIPLADLLAAELGVPCTIDNDAVAAAIGENAYGAGQDSAALLAITLGTGVGVALLTRNAPYRGGDGTHPESRPHPGARPARTLLLRAGHLLGAAGIPDGAGRPHRPRHHGTRRQGGRR